MAIPSVQVFLGEETAGIDGAVTWVDITSYVALEQGISTSRGQSFGGGSQPGSASLTLVNTDGRFTIGNASSPLYPYFRLQAPMKLLRDGRPWFIGRIMAAPLSWPGGGDSDCVVTVTLADKLARYERMRLDSYPVEEITALGPVGYWPMNEPSGSTHADNALPATWPLTYYQPGDGTIAFAGSTGPVGDGRSSPTFTPGTVPPVLMTNSGPFDNTATSQSLSVSAAFATTTGGLVVRLDTAGTLVGQPWFRQVDISVGTWSGFTGLRVVLNDTYGGGGNASSILANCSVMDGATHVVTFTLNPAAASGSQYFLYLDGVALSFPGSLSNDGRYVSLVTDVRVGSGPAVNSGAGYTTAGFAGTISHVAIWTRALSASEAALISGALKGTTLTTNAAFMKVLGWRGQASTALIDAGVTDSVWTPPLGNGTLGAALAALNSSEAGTLWVDGQDRLTWKNRRNLPSPSITLTPADVEPGIVYNSDLSRVQTLVTGSRPNGGNVVVKATDYATIGEITGSVASLSTNPDDAGQHASWAANTGPRDPYIGSLTIDMATAMSATKTAVASGGILSKVTLSGMPSQTPPNSTVLEVIGEQETVSATAWTVTWMVLPAGTNSARDILTWDDPTLGFWDAGHRWAY